MLDLAALRQTPLARTPFEFFVTEETLDPADLVAVRRDFPRIDKPGVFPLSALAYGPAFARLIEEFRSPSFRELIEQKFAVDLAHLPMMITVRGRAQRKDGRIHADSADKVITCLLYLNEAWEAGGGRLRMLRGPADLADYAAEISPSGGTFAAFRVTPSSWHGHEPHVGERRSVMINWIRSDAALARELGRHRLSALAKRALPFFHGGS
jgi:hypothetical protein